MTNKPTIDIKKILESSKTVEDILSRLSENPHKKFLNIFSPLKEDRFVVSYSDSVLSLSSPQSSNLIECLPEVRGLLRENSIDIQKCSEVIDENIGFTIEISLLQKHVEKFCNGKMD